MNVYSITKDIGKFEELIGESEAMQRLYRMIDRVSRAKTTVLISGPSGSGKELVARAIHRRGDRSGGPFIPINCGAIPEDLFASELFGHAKGAFTGANKDKKGVFEAADGGTLLLDEVAEIPISLQVELLRVLQQREVKPLGSTKIRQFDTRILAATNRDLAEEVRKGIFREDLYYRLNVVELTLPSLNKRREDIPLLVNHFIDKYRSQVNRQIIGIDSEAMQILMNYEWKGEVRELENAIERALLLGDHEMIKAEDLPPSIRQTATDNSAINRLTLDYALRNFEKKHIKNVLTQTDGNRAEAARLLDIDPSTLYRKLDRLNIDGHSMQN